jgi:poly(3-hydroxybutyrate) depolymerase
MKASVRGMGLLLGACVLLGIVCPAQEAKPQTMEFGGKTRSYRLHVPPGHDPAKPTPSNNEGD